jgi:hypothetical protein
MIYLVLFPYIHIFLKNNKASALPVSYTSIKIFLFSFFLKNLVNHQIPVGLPMKIFWLFHEIYKNKRTISQARIFFGLLIPRY